METAQRESTRFTESEFISKLRERLPGLNDQRALPWAAAAIKHLAQNLDDRHSVLGARKTIINALSVAREHLPPQQALDIEQDLPSNVAEIWREAARPDMKPD